MRIFCRSAALGILFVCGSLGAFAQSNVYSIHIVGYVNKAFQAGDNLFGNPLESTNTLSYVIPTAPEGTTVSLWNPPGNAYGPIATFTSGAWDTDFTLNPGMGAKLHTPALFTNTFIGTVLAPDGSYFDGNAINPPPPFSGVDGLYLLSSKFPATLSGTSTLSVFEYILGRAPHEGEQFTTLDPATQLYHTTIFLSGDWNNGAPRLGVGESAFFNIGPVAVPEPSVASFVLAGFCIARVISRRR